MHSPFFVLVSVFFNLNSYFPQEDFIFVPTSSFASCVGDG